MHDEFKKEKYDELVSFFKKYFVTESDPLEYVTKNDHIIEKSENSENSITYNDIQDNIENIPKLNGSSQIPS